MNHYNDGVYFYADDCELPAQPDAKAYLKILERNFQHP